MSDPDHGPDDMPRGDQQDIVDPRQRSARVAEDGYRRMLEIGLDVYTRAATLGCEEFALVEDYAATAAVAVGICVDIDDDGEGSGEWLIVCGDGRLLAGPVSILRVDASGRWLFESARQRDIDGRRVVHVSRSDWVVVSVSHPGAGAVGYPPSEFTSSAITVEVDIDTGELTVNGFGDYTNRRLTDMMDDRLSRLADPESRHP